VGYREAGGGKGLLMDRFAQNCEGDGEHLVLIFVCGDEGRDGVQVCALWDLIFAGYSRVGRTRAKRTNLHRGKDSDGTGVSRVAPVTCVS
jgi:hypothetical protein